MEEPEKIMLPRTGRHISAWGHGHTCSQPQHDGPCVCYCGAVQPYEQREEPDDAVPQDRER